jgi:hypothetical protein
MRRALPLFLLAACRSTPQAQDDVSASRADVTASLYRQLELVLARQAELATEPELAARNERAELLRLAAEIAFRIVRIDPQANGESLLERIEQAR